MSDTLAPGWEIQVADLLEHAVTQLAALAADEHADEAALISGAALAVISGFRVMVLTEVTA